MAAKKTLFITDWLDKKPYQNYSAVDLEYLAVANKVHQKIDSFKFLFEQLQISKQQGKDLAVFLTCFLEDLVSETNIWSTFINVNKELFDKKLPFYDTKTGYQQGDINLSDLKFLIWYFLNCIYPERFLSPYDDYLDYLANNIGSVLEDEFEYISENEVLKEEYFLDDKLDFYETRTVIQKLFFDSYLFGLDAKKVLFDQTKNYTEENQNKINQNPEYFQRFMYSFTNQITFGHRTKLLAFKSTDWMASYVGKNHKLYNKLKNCSEKVTGYFFYKKTEGECYVFEHIASEKLFKMYSESYNGALNSDKNAIYYLDIVQWGEHYMLCGVSTQMPFDANIVLDQKNSSDERLKVSNIGEESLEENIKFTLQQEKSFIDTFGSSIVFASEDQLQNCLDLFQNQYHKGLKNNTQKDFLEAQQRFRSKGYFSKNDNFGSTNKNNNVIIFFNKNQGVEIYNNICNIIPDEKNPFYKEEDTLQIKLILFSPEYSKEFAEYFVANYASKLDFFKTGTGAKYLNDFDFLLRFWKPNNYFNLPTISFI